MQSARVKIGIHEEPAGGDGSVACTVNQDTRHVSEPSIPPACATLEAALTATAGDLTEAGERKLDTARIQRAQDECAPGHAVVLRSNSGRNAFLSGPLELRRGVTLAVARRSRAESVHPAGGA